MWIFSQKHLLYVFPDFWRQKRFFFSRNTSSPLWRTPTSKLRVFHVKKIKAETRSANRRQTESRAYVKGALSISCCFACVVHVWAEKHGIPSDSVTSMFWKWSLNFSKRSKRSENDEREAIESIQNLLWKIEKNWEKSMIFHLCRTLLSLHAICNPKELELVISRKIRFVHEIWQHGEQSKRSTGSQLRSTINDITLRTMKRKKQDEIVLTKRDVWKRENCLTTWLQLMVIVDPACRCFVLAGNFTCPKLAQYWATIMPWKLSSPLWLSKIQQLKPCSQTIFALPDVCSKYAYILAVEIVDELYQFGETILRSKNCKSFIVLITPVDLRIFMITD